MRFSAAPLLALAASALVQAQSTPALPPLLTGDWAGLEARLGRAAAQDQFSGVVLAVQGDHVLCRKAYGLANRADGIPNTLDTRFNLASLGKLFTTVAIGQLLEQGKLRLDDPILEYLPEYRGQAGWDKVKVKHLLSHTGGFGSYWGPAFDARRGDIRAVKDYFPLFLGKPLAFDPGTRWQYSNVGFILLGAILEKVSGEDYFAYIQHHVFDPAGMKDSGFFEMDQDIPRLATGYFHPRDDHGKLLGPGWLNDTLVRPAKGGPAGGSYATAPDLVRFARALLSGRLLKPETLKRLAAPVSTFPTPAGVPLKLSYGYGFDVPQLGSKSFFGHNGGAPGVCTNLLVDPATDTMAVLLSNLAPADVGPIGFWFY